MYYNMERFSFIQMTRYVAVILTASCHVAPGWILHALDLIFILCLTSLTAPHHRFFISALSMCHTLSHICAERERN